MLLCLELQFALGSHNPTLSTDAASECQLPKPQINDAENEPHSPTETSNGTPVE